MRAGCAVAVATLLASACGGSEPAVDVAADVEAPPAVLAVVDTLLERTPGGSVEAVAASTGDEVATGDLLEADATGFGEVAHPDGSLTRVGPGTTLRLERLASSVEAADVRVQLDVGRTFHAVRDEGPGDAYEVATAVGVAAVRGTAFVVTCDEPRRCLVVVLDGTVEVTGLDGLAVEVGAGEQVVLDDDGVDGPAPAEPDPWIDDNLARGVPGLDPDDPGVVGGRGPAPDPPPRAEELWTIEDVVAATADHPSSGAAWSLTSCSEPDSLVAHEGEGDPQSRCQWGRDEFTVFLAPFSVTTRTYWLQDPATERTYGACPGGEVLADIREVDGVEVVLEQCLIDNSGVDNGIGRAVATIDGYDLVVETFWMADDDQNTRDDLAARERHWETLLALVRAGLLRYPALS